MDRETLGEILIFWPGALITGNRRSLGGREEQSNLGGGDREAHTQIITEGLKWGRGGWRNGFHILQIR